jgi:hypothetical protein
MPTVRVLVTHELPTYREALGEALRLMRPQAEVVVVEPTNLDGEVERRQPHIIFGSRLSDTARSSALAWALLNPQGKQLVETSVAGERATSSDLPFAAILALVDSAEHLARSTPAATT